MNENLHTAIRLISMGSLEMTSWPCSPSFTTDVCQYMYQYYVTRSSWCAVGCAIHRQ